MDEEQIYQAWLNELDHHKVTHIADNFSDIRSYLLDWQTIESEELRELILDYPEICIRVGEAAINSFLEPDQKVGINLRIYNLFNSHYIRVRNIRSENLSKFVSIEGEIKKVTEVRPKCLVGVFSCLSCGFKQEIEQDNFQFTEPMECPKDDGGCGKRAGSTSFKFELHESLFIDAQKIQLSEKREDLRGIQQPQSIDCQLEDDLCKDWTPGDIIKVTGSVKTKQRKIGNTKSTTFIPYIHVNHIDDVNVEGYNVDYNKDEISTWFHCHRDNILEHLTQSFCPEIKGWDRVKQVMILQHAGGSMSNARSEIHICLVGDPGTAKSSLGEWSAELVPGSVKVDLSGDNVTANGMTATAVKDEFGEGSWSIEAGAVVKAHRKILYLDECHLGKKEIIGSLHRPMESQEFGVSKAGLSRTFRSEFSAIFSMNPKQGRFKQDDLGKALIDLMDNTKFTAPWRDRIDYFAMMQDKRDEKKDREMFRHITENKRGELTPEVDKTLMMQFFAYIKDTFHPVITKLVEKEIEDKFVEMRKDEGVYNRHLLSIFRFAEASAKVHCRDTVNSEDIDLAVKLVRESLQVMTAGYGNAIDMDAHLKGASRGKRALFKMIMDKIEELHVENDYRGANENDLFQEMLKMNIEDPENYIKELANRGEIAYSHIKDVKHWRCA